MPAPSSAVPMTEVRTMKAIVQTEYGSPDVLSLAEVDRPLVPDNGVLVKVHAASVDAGVWHLMRGTPFLIRLMYGGLRKPKYPILGSAIAGRVEAVGKAVTQFQPGDEVFGDLSESGFGGFADYACAPEEALALKPSNLSFEEAATIPVSGSGGTAGAAGCGSASAWAKSPGAGRFRWGGVLCGADCQGPGGKRDWRCQHALRSTWSRSSAQIR
jgi:NADPH:quinone reductase-like Zn-dependent oxidoreductase